MEKRFFISSESFEYETNINLNSLFSTECDNFENKYNTFYEDLYEESDIFLPVSIFSTKLGSLQTIVKYLKEYKELKFSEIADLIHRDQRTVWNIYNKAKSVNIIVEDSKVYIPLSTIKNRSYSVLGSLIRYLKNKGFSFKEISLLLKRNYQTIYTTYRKNKHNLEGTDE